MSSMKQVNSQSQNTVKYSTLHSDWHAKDSNYYIPISMNIPRHQHETWVHLNPLEPSGYYTYRRVQHQKHFIFPTECTYGFRVNLTKATVISIYSK
jgi:hypothetical protein